MLPQVIDIALLYVVGMTDIIWQQHNYHRTQPQSKLQTINQYGPEQPERIHFNVSDTHISTIRFPATDQQSDLLKNSFVNSSSSTTAVHNAKIQSSSNSFSVTATAKIPNNPQHTDSHNLLLERRNTATKNKWSIAIDDNQNPQVFCCLMFMI